MAISTITIQQIVNQVRAWPELQPIFGTSGWEQEPAITIANDVLQEFLAAPMDWKWNRVYGPPFVTVALQQDYPTAITNLGWLEGCWRVDLTQNSLPLPVFTMESVRDTGATSYQANPWNISWVYNYQAIVGTWQANTAYPTGVGTTSGAPVSPVQSFVDANGNILYVTAWGTSGSVQPILPANSAAGTTVVDNTVTWTVADPWGICLRIVPLPASGGLPWQITPIYQKIPPVFKSLTQTIAPIPDVLGYLFRQGFISKCYALCPGEASKKHGPMYMEWKDNLMTAIRSGDREREDACFYPGSSISGGNGWDWSPLMNPGPAWPYQPFGW